MLRFFIKKLLLAATTLITVSVITFGLFFAAPNNPAELMCGNRKTCTPAQQESIARRMGLDKPVAQQYADFMAGIVKGRTFGEGDAMRECPAPCLGYSFRNDEPVTDIIGRTLPVTLSIVFGAAVVWLLIGVSVGMVSALRKGTIFDRGAVGFSLAGASMPILLFGPLLLIIFVYETGWLAYPSYTPITENPAKWAAAMLLPWLALGFINSALYARLSRAQMVETLSEDFVRTARAKGMTKFRVYGKHALRAAITPIVTIAGLDLGTYLGGTVVTETIFGFTGLGKASLNAAINLDMPLVMATVLLAALFIVAANVIVDVLYSFIDPRVRLA
ncbi:ABC transporter permease [Asanoa sp. NPDC049518]|uniref:ABC transporter permease n=1 Tax=unclassified Asanoa TaxID=2685164 RepID=UPI00343F6D0C